MSDQIAQWSSWEAFLLGVHKFNFWLQNDSSLTSFEGLEGIFWKFGSLPRAAQKASKE